jgi:single-stranded DNA-binding protein
MWSGSTAPGVLQTFAPSGDRHASVQSPFWRQLAEHVSETLGKGARAIVIGRLRLRSWETDEGERRSLIEVEADDVAPR